MLSVGCKVTPLLLLSVGYKVTQLLLLLAIRSHRCCCCLLQILSLGTYLLACVFFSVYSMAVDTLFLCFREYPFTSCQSSVTSCLFFRSSPQFLSALSVFPSVPVCFVSPPSLPVCSVSLSVTSCLLCQSPSLPVCSVSIAVTSCLFCQCCRHFLSALSVSVTSCLFRKSSSHFLSVFTGSVTSF